MKTIFQDVCGTDVEDDGMSFDPSAVTATRIKEDADYEGVRVQLKAKLGTAVLGIQVDVGFGDAVTPAPVVADFPVLLASPAPRMKSILGRPSSPRSSKQWCSSGSPTAG